METENEDNAQSIDEVISDEGQRSEMESITEESEHKDYRGSRKISQKKESNHKIKNCANSPDNQSQVKGFSIDAENKIVCLDCDKVFTLKSSYNLHKRMYGI